MFVTITFSIIISFCFPTCVFLRLVVLLYKLTAFLRLWCNIYLKKLLHTVYLACAQLLQALVTHEHMVRYVDHNSKLILLLKL